MQSAGLDRVVRAEDVAHMGITEVIRHMPYIYGKYRDLVASIKLRRPDVAILIDFPDVNLRLARELKKLNIPVVYFVSPQLWAWKRRRLRWVQQRVDRMMVIFPFEAPFYRARSVNAEFVGHPLAELPLPTISREDYAQQHNLDPSKQWIALLPGSRTKEVKLNLPTMLDTAAALGSDYEYLIPIASTLKPDWVDHLITNTQTQNRKPIHLVPDAREALHHARASIVASGTATVQAAVIGNPFVVVYRVSPLTYAIAKRVVTVPHVAMANLIAGKRAVPELIQDDFTSSKIVQHLEPLLPDGLPRESMMKELKLVGGLLRSRRAGSSGENKDAIERVAAITLELIQTASPAQEPSVMQS